MLGTRRYPPVWMYRYPYCALLTTAIHQDLTINKTHAPLLEIHLEMGWVCCSVGVVVFFIIIIIIPPPTPASLAIVSRERLQKKKKKKK